MTIETDNTAPFRIMECATQGKRRENKERNKGKYILEKNLTHSVFYFCIKSRRSKKKRKTEEVLLIFSPSLSQAGPC